MMLGLIGQKRKNNGTDVFIKNEQVLCLLIFGRDIIYPP